MKCLVGIHMEKPSWCGRPKSGAWGDLEENTDLGHLYAGRWEARAVAVTIRVQRGEEVRMQSSGQALLTGRCQEHPDGAQRWGGITQGETTRNRDSQGPSKHSGPGRGDNGAERGGQGKAGFTEAGEASS